MSFTFLTNSFIVLDSDLLQMGIIPRTFQALGILPLNALKKLKNHQPAGREVTNGFWRFFACSQVKYLNAEWTNLIGPAPKIPNRSKAARFLKI